MNWEVLVPTRDTIADYSQSMARSVAVVQREAENRSQLDVFYDLSATGADVIQMRASSAVLEEPLSLRESAGLLNDAYNMLAASARSAENPRPAYRGKMSVEVANYLDSVRPLPNDYRGYALTLHSPVPVGFERQEDLGDEFRTPFSRQATYKLAQGLKHASSAIECTFVDYTLDPFEKGVDYGLSANFYDSVAELALKSHGVEIGLAWAGVRPASMPNSHSNSRQHLPTSLKKQQNLSERGCLHTTNKSWVTSSNSKRSSTNLMVRQQYFPCGMGV